MLQLTISIDNYAKRKLYLLAKKRNQTESELINEWINEESEKIKLKISGKGLGTYLSELPLTGTPDFRNEKEMFGMLKEEKHVRNA